MWTAIRDVLLSQNVIIVLGFIGFVLLTAIILSKTGLLRITTKAVQVGAVNREREIVWQQCEWIRQHYEGMQTKIPKPKGYNEWRGRYVLTCVTNQWVEWIYFNHFQDDAAYIEIKQDRIIALIREHTIKDEYQSDDFEKFIRDDVKYCIKKLIKIRNVFR